MIVLLGSTGYVGQTFARIMTAEQIPWKRIDREQVDIYDPERLSQFLAKSKASFLINCAGYTGKPNVDACELHKADCLLGNAVLPGRLAIACEQAKIPWGHVSSGCIYSGSKHGAGFTEEDTPNFSFRTNHCSYYSGTKALGEEILADYPSCYIWRLRIPFNEYDSPRNFLSKVMRYDRLLDATNSLSHLDEFVRASLLCWSKKVPFGIYNIVNSGSISTREVVELIRMVLAPQKKFEFFADEDEFMRIAAKTPRSNCILDNTKIQSVGIPLRSIREAIRHSLENWRA